MLLQQGALIQALEVCHLNLHFMNGAFSQFNEDAFAKYVNSAAAGLSSEEITAAQDRGESLDLWATAEALLAEFEAGMQTR